MNLTQGTPEWLEWRRRGLGSSDCPIIMGDSPYKTPRQLFYEKLGTAKQSTSNWAQDRGHEWEPKARAAYELQISAEAGRVIDLPPAIMEHEEFSWLRVSLDGWNEAESLVLEIKVPGATDHAKAVAGGVPEHYWPQVQMQLMVTGARELHYWSYLPGVGGALVKVTRDSIYQIRLFSELLDFWHRVTTSKEPPPLMDMDVVDRDEDDAFRELCVRLRDAKEEKDAAESRYEEVRDALAVLMTHTRERAAGVLLTKTFTKGRIDYSKAVPPGVDVEQFRMAGTWSVRPTFLKKG